MSKKEAIEKIAGYLGEDVLSMSTTNNESGLTTDSSVGSKDNSSAKGKITLEEFFARTDKVVLNIPTQEEFSAMVKIFKDLGITTNSGREFKEGMWQKYEHLTIISPERKIGAGVESAKYYGYEVINFKDLDLEKYLSQEELTKLGIEISPNEVEEVVESVEGLNSSDNSQLSKNQYKITIDEFWEQQNKQLAIHCDEEWKADILMKVFDKMGKVWNGGNKYTHHNNFNVYKSDTCYCCRRSYCKISYYEENKYVIYPFDQVDLSKYLTQEQVEEIKNKLGFNPLQNNQSVQTHSAQDSATQNKNTQNVQNTQKQNVQNTQKQNVQNTQDQNVSKQRIDYKITIDEFWEPQNKNKKLAIHCNEEWKANILMKVFDRMGKTWKGGCRYTQNNYFDRYKSNTCYDCATGQFSRLSYYEDNCYVIYPFDQVDLSKYLTQEEVEEIKSKLGFNPLQNNQSVQTQSVQSSVTQNNQGNNTQKQNVQNTQKQNVQNTQTQNAQNTQKQNVQNTQDQNVSKQRIDYKITVDDFWMLGFLEGKRMAIHCDESWKSEILTEVFARMGETWSTGERYAARSYFYKYAENTCYTNFGQLYTYSDCNGYYIYDFLEVDLRRYLTPVQANWYRYHLGSENTRGLL